MKRCMLVAAAVLLTLLCVLVFGVFDASRYYQTVDFGKIADGPLNSENTGSSEDIHLSLSYEGVTLPVGADGAVLIPLIPENGLTVFADRGAALTRTKIKNNTWRITAQVDGAERSLSLVETGMALCMIDIPDSSVKDPSDPIGEEDVEASCVLLSGDGSGNLLVEREPVALSVRGHSSRTYLKKSYTLTVKGPSGKKAARSLMGFSADTKFGLNSMYEDDSKIRDALSLELWQKMISPEDRCEALRFRYCELFVNGEYRGLYGFQQVTTEKTAGISAGDALIKIAHPMTKDSDVSVLRKKFEVKRELPGEDVAERFAEVLLGLERGDEAAAGLFDIDTLIRVFVFTQVTAAVDNRFENLAGVWRADRNRFSLAVFDTDLTFALTGDRAVQPLKTRVKPELASIDMMTADPQSLKPAAALLNYGTRYTGELAAYYFSLRDTVLSEETLLSRARELFAFVTESGARERERVRWPEGARSDSGEAIETFISERLKWCDGYFSALADGSFSAN